jgi:hypothetical protein
MSTRQHARHLPRVSRAIRTVLPEAARTRRACGIQTRRSAARAWFAPIRLGKLNEGGALVHAHGRTWGQLIFQDLFKKEQ